MKSDRLLNAADSTLRKPSLNERGGAAQRRVSAVMRRRDAEPRGGFLITVKVDVVDAHFAGLNTIHYLLKVRVFDLQSITD